MPHLPEWVIERLKRPVAPEPRMQLNPDPDPDPDPVPVDEHYAAIACPDPECRSKGLLVYRNDLPAFYVVPAHFRPTAKWGADPRCWLSGMHIRDAREFIRIREENGGRLKRAAHP